MTGFGQAGVDIGAPVPGVTTRPKAARGPHGATRRRRTIAAVVLLAALAIAAAAYSVGSAVWAIIRGIHTEISEPVPVPRPGQNINVLFLGLDAVVDSSGRVNLNAPLRGSYSRTDTMILISVNPATNEAALISIPRDSRCEIPGRGWEKANHAHAYGGPALSMKTVELMLGIDVHYYVRTNYHGVESIVNVLNGVEINVEKRMQYEDPYQDLVIDLHPGLQLLDGDKALQYLRYRNVGGDIGRIARQQSFINALVRKIMSFGTVFRAGALAREVVKYIDTNMGTSEILEYAMLAARINDPQIEMVTLPGRDQKISDNGGQALWYWVLDAEATAAIIDRLVWGIDKEANSQITVRVLNGSGITGQAAGMAARLATDGFNVIEVANAPSSDHEITQIISHVSDQALSDRVAKSVMRYTQDPEALRELLGEPPSDVTIIVGTDFSARGR